MNEEKLASLRPLDHRHGLAGDDARAKDDASDGVGAKGSDETAHGGQHEAVRCAGCFGEPLGVGNTAFFDLCKEVDPHVHVDGDEFLGDARLELRGTAFHELTLRIWIVECREDFVEGRPLRFAGARRIAVEVEDFVCAHRAECQLTIASDEKQSACP